MVKPFQLAKEHLIGPGEDLDRDHVSPAVALADCTMDLCSHSRSVRDVMLLVAFPERLDILLHGIPSSHLFPCHSGQQFAISASPQ